MNTHPDTFLALDKLGSEVRPYRPTHEYGGRFIDEAHEELANVPVGEHGEIRVADPGKPGEHLGGWLRRADALKIYELAYFSEGDILEIGSFSGMSTSIIARANARSPNPVDIYTVDIDPAATETTLATLRGYDLQDRVAARTVNASIAVKEFAEAGQQFGFVFIDHSHTYEDVHNVCVHLGRITTPGGFCLFHDFNDARNNDWEELDYGVFQAVRDGLDKDVFEFCGLYGCTGLYRAAP